MNSVKSQTVQQVSTALLTLLYQKHTDYLCELHSDILS